jgi:hypothetical protein
MRFSEFARQDSSYLRTCVKLYKLFFYLLLVSYFVLVSVLTYSSLGQTVVSIIVKTMPSLVVEQISILNELGPQFGAAYLVHGLIFLVFPPIFAIKLAQASSNLIRSAKNAGHVFPELYKLASYAVVLSVWAFVPLLLSGSFAGGAARSISDRVVLWPTSVGITLGASFFMMIGLHLVFLAASLGSAGRGPR